MIRKLIRRVFELPAGKRRARPKVLPLAQHGIHRDRLSHAALKVVTRLQEAGFEAYVIEDATRAIDLNDSLAAAWKDMTAAGVRRIQSSAIPL